MAVLAARRDRTASAVLFAVDYLSHLFSDVYGTLLSVPPDQWSSTYIASLVWPLLPVPGSETMAFLPYFTRVEPTRYAQVAVGLALFGIIFAAPEIRKALERRRPPQNQPPDDTQTAASQLRFESD